MSTQYIEIHQHLIDGCRRGERTAQRDIYQLYAKAMFNVSMRILNDFAEAEDMLQEAFVDAFRKIDSFKGEASFGAWLKRIVINKSLNQLKKRKSYQNTIEEYEAPPEDSKEALAAEVLQLERVNKAIQQLPDGFRTVLTLYLLEDYSHKQIAEALDISESTSKSQLNRAKAKLREILQNQ